MLWRRLGKAEFIARFREVLLGMIGLMRGPRGQSRGDSLWDGSHYSESRGSTPESPVPTRHSPRY
ncbi:hypothetical protein Lbir_0008 [Legionella birminghamensis]|uniref:Uncharacterized protein n=1 Tax=Legionella birminghamensis TaxID=28083 RepID=A0A378IBB7_9GAMM|nr:hypothetical protein Lbir_0008 [Legionella birminghamensis]STX32065.1 Uncharacterised protein [Legionella birminghamensis]